MVSERTGRIFDIKRYAIHDGPGIRTTVFLKGCPLACPWCHNPEGLSKAPKVAFEYKRCIGCGTCIEICPEAAISRTKVGMATDSRRCKGCGDCVNQCPACARELIERSLTPRQLLEIIKKDTIFYDESGGGVTFSGGEPLLQAGFLIDILDRCGHSEIHRAVDTSGYSDKATIEKVAQRTDLFLYDLKLIDSNRHRQLTGVPSETIIDNFKFLYSLGANITIRLPLIPGINDDHKNIKQICDFLSDFPNCQDIHVLPYHDYQKEKYIKLGLDYPANNIAEVHQEKIALPLQRFREKGFKVRLGG